MAAPYVRQSKAPDTTYVQFKAVRSARAGLNSASTVDADTGASPISRWLAFAFDYDDLASNTAGGETVTLTIPRGTLVMDCYLRLDTVFASGTHTAATVGDANQAAGYGTFNLTALDTAGVPRWFHDADGVYVDVENADLAIGATGAQFYQNGGAVLVLANTNFRTAATAGQAMIFLKTISYHEDLNAEW